MELIFLNQSGRNLTISFSYVPAGIHRQKQIHHNRESAGALARPGLQMFSIPQRRAIFFRPGRVSHSMTRAPERGQSCAARLPTMPPPQNQTVITELRLRLADGMQRSCADAGEASGNAVRVGTGFPGKSLTRSWHRSRERNLRKPVVLIVSGQHEGSAILFQRNNLIKADVVTEMADGRWFQPHRIPVNADRPGSGHFQALPSCHDRFRVNGSVFRRKGPAPFQRCGKIAVATPPNNPGKA